MNKYCVLMLTGLLSGCSLWHNMDLSWDMLNPWATEVSEGKVDKVNVSEELPVNVNKYLWNASVNKLSFMGFNEKNPQEGVIVTTWKSPRLAANERFQIVVKIKDGELRADALNVQVYKEVRGQKGWLKSSASEAFKAKVEEEIINQAKIFYIKDKSKEY